MRRVVVIGAGLGGMSAAVRLASAGYDVEVFERLSFAGGKAGSQRIGGYRFDTGPSLFTMPSVFRQLFDEAGASIDDYLVIRPLEAVCRYFFADGTRLTSFGDAERFAAEVEERIGEPGEHLRAFLRYSARIHDVASRLFLWNSLNELSSYANRAFLRSLLRLGGIDALRTMDRANRSFFDDERMVQLFNRYATYNGSSPYRVPATLNIIPHVEYTIGAGDVAGGIYAIPQAIRRLAEEKGVRFHFGTQVERITVSGSGRRRPVRAVVVRDREIPCELVVSNADVISTYSRLLGDTRAPLYRRYLRLEPSSSGLVYYLGMRRRFPQLGLHNVFFSNDYRTEFSQIFDDGIPPTAPTVYLNITSKTTPEDAPPGCENWFVLVNAPPNRGQDWARESVRTRGAVLATIGSALGFDVEPFIEAEGIMTPADIESLTGSTYGSLYGVSSNSRAAAFLRHPNRSRRYPGLFFLGGSAHPGGGMPLAVLSGKITADIVRRRYPV